MKQFLVKNWYRMIIGTSLLMASFGFMIYSVTSVNAKDLNNTAAYSNYKMLPVNEDGTISVKLSDEQLNKIMPKNEDGSINIKLSEKQLKAITPNSVQAVDIQFVNGWAAANYPAYSRDGTQYCALGVSEINPY